MGKNRKVAFKMTKKGLREVVTISAVVLTLAGPTIPIIANAAAETEAVETEAAGAEVAGTTRVETYSEVSVSTQQELTNALTNKAITKINLLSDISAGLNQTHVDGDKEINGNQHTLTLTKGNYINGRTPGQTIKLKDLKLRADSKDSIYSYYAINIELEDVQHVNSGVGVNANMIYLPAVNSSIKISGDVTSTGGGALAYGNMKYINILSGANVNIEHQNQYLHTIYAPAADAELNIYEGANLNIVQSNISNVDDAIELSSGKVNVAGKLKINTKANRSAVYAKDMAVLSGSDVDLQNYNKDINTIVTRNTLVFYTGANISVSNTGGGVALGGYAATDVAINSSEGVSIWATGNTGLVKPDKNYKGPFSASFKLSGYTNAVSTSNLVSNNNEFIFGFSGGSTGKIALGSYAQTSINQTTINELTTDSTQAIGTAEPNADISIKVGTTELGKGKVGSDGKYSITIPKQVNGVTVKVVATLNSMSSEAFTVVKSVTAGSITPATYKLGNPNITGTYTGDVAKAILKKNGVVQNPTTGAGNFENGNFQYWVGNTIKDTDVLTLTALDKNGKVLQADMPVVIEKNTAGSITPVTYKLGNPNITGTYTGDVAKAILKKNGVVQNPTTGAGNFENGNFQYWVGNTIKDTDVLTLTALDKNGKVLQADMPVVIEKNTAGSITPATYKLGNPNITGAYTGDVAKAILKKNGMVQNPTTGAGNFENGNFQYWVGNTIKDTDVLTLTALDKNGKVLQADVPVVIEKDTEGTITPSEYKVGDTNITGTYTGDVKKAQLFVNDKASGWGGTFTVGSFTYYAIKANIKAGDKVVLVGYDSNDKELDRKTVTVETGIAGAVTSATYKIGDGNITGTFTGDVARAQLKINGVVKGGPAGTFNSDGTFTYWAKGLDIKASDDVTLTALDINNNQLQESFTVVLNDSEGTISDVSYKVGASNIAGKFTGDVARVQLKINGNKVGSPAGTFNSNGTFTYWAKNLNIQTTDEVVLDALDIQDNVLKVGVEVEVQE